jgi:hypothetical protein
MQLPHEGLQIIEAAVDRELRLYRPRAEPILDRVRKRCRRAGWALNPEEAVELQHIVQAYIGGLRPRPRPQHITDTTTRRVRRVNGHATTLVESERSSALASCEEGGIRHIA